MPTYEYECLECGKQFEKFQQITDEPISNCPDCNGKVKKLISGGSGIIFKGSGFYVNDYKKKENKKTSDSKPVTCCGNNKPCESPSCQTNNE